MHFTHTQLSEVWRGYMEGFMDTDDSDDNDNVL